MTLRTTLSAARKVEESRWCVARIFHEGKLLTPCSSYATLEQVEAGLMGEGLIIRSGLLWTEILRPDRLGLEMTHRG